MAPVSSVVVVFPLVPVMPTIGAGHSRRTAPSPSQSDTPARSRRRQIGRLSRNGRVTHQHVRPVQILQPMLTENEANGQTLNASRVGAKLLRRLEIGDNDVGPCSTRKRVTPRPPP